MSKDHFYVADYDEGVRVRLSYHYSPGHRAFTPRGEYGPIDPPEPAEIYIGHVEIEVSPQVWRNATKAEGTTIREWAWDNLFSELEERAVEDDAPDPDAAYEAARDDKDRML